MTGIIGFLVGGYGPNGASISLSLDPVITEITMFESFPPWGALLYVSHFADPEMGSTERFQFLNDVRTVFEGIEKKGFREVRMAATLLSDNLEDYEVRDVGRIMSPYSFEDWLILAQTLEENFQRAEIRGRGIISVAEIGEAKIGTITD